MYALDSVRHSSKLRRSFMYHRSDVDPDNSSPLNVGMFTRTAVLGSVPRPDLKGGRYG